MNETLIQLSREKLDKMLDDIAEKEWSVVDGLFPESFLSALKDEVKLYWAEGEFRKAGVGIGEKLTVRPEIRSDRVLWLDDAELTPLQQQYWDLIEELRKELNYNFFIGLKSFEAHFAVYPAGSFYKKHLDQFKEVNYRKITCLLYLNDDWTDADGGQLRVYHPGDESSFTDIIPVNGRFVCFKSSSVFHEVLPSKRERFSLTGWLRTI